MHGKFGSIWDWFTKEYLRPLGADIFPDRAGDPVGLIVMGLGLALLAWWGLRLWLASTSSSGSGKKKAWTPTLRIIMADPEILFFGLVSTAFSCLPFLLLYFAGTNATANAAMAWAASLFASGTATTLLPPLTPEVILTALLLLPGFFLAFALSAAAARLMHFAVVHTAWRRLSGDSPGFHGALGTLLRRSPEIAAALADIRGTAGTGGTFLPQYMMIKGESRKEAARHSATRASLMDGGKGPSTVLAGIAFRPVRPAKELETPFFIGAVVAWLSSFVVAFGFGPVDNVPWIIFGLFGTIIGYCLAALNLMALLNSVYLTAVFLARDGTAAASPLLSAYDPMHLRRPFP